MCIRDSDCALGLFLRSNEENLTALGRQFTQEVVAFFYFLDGLLPVSYTHLNIARIETQGRNSGINSGKVSSLQALKFVPAVVTKMPI